MKKLRKSVVFVLFAALAAPSFADNHEVESDGYDLMGEMILRPVFGLPATIIGAAVYAAVSPLTALFMIPKPHDSFVKLADTLVCKPAKWTFVRPIGDYRYNEGCARKVQPVVYQPAPPVVEAPKPMVKPQVQYPDDTNKKIDTIFKKRMMK
ncbi:hypothetical protein [Methylobacter svalbardensis]|uniref:hypothetical protein n=1 Tax=Methylobacter svalbardensis TaxID=3080016 RepID=UPI0030EB5BBC